MLANSRNAISNSGTCYMSLLFASISGTVMDLQSFKSGYVRKEFVELDLGYDGEEI